MSETTSTTATSTTDRLDLPLVQERQAQKHITVNASLKRLDAIIHIAIEHKDHNHPPTDASEGNAYIVGSAPGGGWSNHPRNLAILKDSVWLFFPPKIGMSVWNKQDNKRYTYYNSDWNIEN